MLPSACRTNFGVNEWAKAAPGGEWWSNAAIDSDTRHKHLLESTVIKYLSNASEIRTNSGHRTATRSRGTPNAAPFLRSPASPANDSPLGHGPPSSATPPSSGLPRLSLCSAGCSGRPAWPPPPIWLVPQPDQEVSIIKFDE